MHPSMATTNRGGSKKGFSTDLLHENDGENAVIDCGDIPWNSFGSMWEMFELNNRCINEQSQNCMQKKSQMVNEMGFSFSR